MLREDLIEALSFLSEEECLTVVMKAAARRALAPVQAPAEAVALVEGVTEQMGASGATRGIRVWLLCSEFGWTQSEAARHYKIDPSTANYHVNRLSKEPEGPHRRALRELRAKLRTDDEGPPWPPRVGDLVVDEASDHVALVVASSEDLVLVFKPDGRPEWLSFSDIEEDGILVMRDGKAVQP